MAGLVDLEGSEDLDCKRVTSEIFKHAQSTRQRTDEAAFDRHLRGVTRVTDREPPEHL